MVGKELPPSQEGEGFVFSKKTREILERLAAEDGISVADFVGELVGREDEKRHIIWDRSKKEFVREKCGRELCKETNVVPERDRAD